MNSRTEPRSMLAFLRGRGVGERKLRLFAVGCCRRIWDRLNIVSREAVEVAEQLADHVTGSRDMTLYFRYADAIGLNSSARAVVAPDAWRAAQEAAILAARHAARSAEMRNLGVAERVEAAAQADLFRDIVHPFRPTQLDASWLMPPVLALAQRGYEDRLLPSGNLNPENLAALAAALEAAGCQDAELLSHLRDAGPHARGCWVLDLLLGKS